MSGPLGTKHSRDTFRPPFKRQSELKRGHQNVRRAKEHTYSDPTVDSHTNKLSSEEHPTADRDGIHVHKRHRSEGCKEQRARSDVGSDVGVGASTSDSKATCGESPARVKDTRCTQLQASQVEKPAPRPSASRRSESAHTSSFPAIISGLAQRVERISSIFSFETCDNPDFVNAVGQATALAIELLDSAEEQKVTESQCQTLDAAGTVLWNRTVFILCHIRDDLSGAGLATIANCRLIAFACFKVGVPEGVEDQALLRRLLFVAAKASLGLLDAGDDVRAASILESVAQFGSEDRAAHGDEADPEAEEAKAAFCIARFAVEGKRGSGAELYHLEKALEITSASKRITWTLGEACYRVVSVAEKRLSMACGLQSERESTFHEIRPLLCLAQDTLRSCRAVQRENFTSVFYTIKLMIVKIDYEFASLTQDDERAKEILTELETLCTLARNDPDISAKLAIVRVQIMSAFSVGAEDMVGAWQHLLQHIQVSDETVGFVRDFVSTLMPKTDALQHDVIFQFLSYFTSRIVEHRSKISSWIASVGRLWLPALRHLTLRNIEQVSKVFDEIERVGDMQLSKEVALSWQLTLEEAADRLGEENSEIVSLYELAAHPIFFCLSENVGGFRRRAARALVKSERLDDALTQLRKCPDPSDPKTAVQLLSIYTQQGQEGQAISIVKQLDQSGALKNDWLLWIVDLSMRAKLSKLKEVSLGLLLLRDQNDKSLDEVFCHLRNAIQLIIQRIREVGTYEDEDDQLIVGLLDKTIDICSKMDGAQRSSCTNELDWLVKTVYNLSVEHCSGITPQVRLQLSQYIQQFVELRLKISSDVDAEILRVRLWTSMNLLNFLVSDDVEDGEDKLSYVLDLSEMCLEHFRSAKEASGSTYTFDDVETAILLIEIDALISLKQWQSLSDLVTRVFPSLDYDSLAPLVETLFSSETVCPVQLCASAIAQLFDKVISEASAKRCLSTAAITLWTRVLLQRLSQGGIAQTDELIVVQILSDKVVPMLQEKSVTLMPGWNKAELQWCRHVLWNWMHAAATRRKSQLAEELASIAFVFMAVDGTPSHEVNTRRVHWESISSKISTQQPV